ncbi:uncharacterized protein K452DRAFT_362679 [Aplosporella prunicola CBS 121167]|uniref:Uncharacterized protein n=1 Tax=Aplosporella prunicola CBS 121167 TaxID=1176127 RepID=A0A6A6AWT8_9PEZI|nr:uncharacterized protein K452DRAFT_362679 [Aplosporella prunicola CBS 121167]KAF2136200.1 hypothetical protein K452DRAFT_362679 [Aplosporella prunicola CBS 121167]
MAPIDETPVSPPTVEEELEALIANGSPESMDAVAKMMKALINERDEALQKQKKAEKALAEVTKERDEALQLIKQRDAASAEIDKGFEPMSRKAASVGSIGKPFSHSEREARRPQDPGFSSSSTAPIVGSAIPFRGLSEVASRPSMSASKSHNLLPASRPVVSFSQSPSRSKMPSAHNIAYTREPRLPSGYGLPAVSEATNVETAAFGQTHEAVSPPSTTRSGITVPQFQPAPHGPSAGSHIASRSTPSAASGSGAGGATSAAPGATGPSASSTTAITQKPKYASMAEFTASWPDPMEQPFYHPGHDPDRPRTKFSMDEMVQAFGPGYKVIAELEPPEPLPTLTKYVPDPDLANFPIPGPLIRKRRKPLAPAIQTATPNPSSQVTTGFPSSSAGVPADTSALSATVGTSSQGPAGFSSSTAPAMPTVGDLSSQTTAAFTSSPVDSPVGPQGSPADLPIGTGSSHGLPAASSTASTGGSDSPFAGPESHSS